MERQTTNLKRSKDNSSKKEHQALGVLTPTFTEKSVSMDLGFSESSKLARTPAALIISPSVALNSMEESPKADGYDLIFSHP